MFNKVDSEVIIWDYSLRNGREVQAASNYVIDGS